MTNPTFSPAADNIEWFVKNRWFSQKIAPEGREKIASKKVHFTKTKKHMIGVIRASVWCSGDRSESTRPASKYFCTIGHNTEVATADITKVIDLWFRESVWAQAGISHASHGHPYHRWWSETHFRNLKPLIEAVRIQNQTENDDLCSGISCRVAPGCLRAPQSAYPWS